MALQRIPATTAQRTSRVWDLFDLIYDTDTGITYLGDMVTTGGIALGAGGGGGVLTVNGDAGPGVVLTPEDLFGGAAPVSPANDGMGYVWNGGSWTLAPSAGGTTTFLGLTDTPGAYAGAALQSVRVNAAATGLEFFTPAASTNIYAADGALAGNRVVNLAGFSLSMLNANLGLQVAPALGTANLRTGDGSLLGVSNTTGVAMTIPAGRDLRVNGNAGTVGQVLISQGASNPPIWGTGVTVDLNTTVASTAGALGAAPVSAPASPDIGDVHVEGYTDAQVWWVWNGATWVNTLSAPSAANLYTANGALPAATARVASFPDSSSYRFDGTGTAANTFLRVQGTNVVSAQAANAGLTAGSALTLGTASATIQTLGAVPINLLFGATAPLQLNGVPGNNGQVLQSRGAVLPPIWADGPGNIYTTDGAIGAGIARVATVAASASLTFQGPTVDDGLIRMTPASDRVEVSVSSGAGLTGIDLTPAAFGLNTGTTTPLHINGSAGLNRQVLTTRGPGLAPIWADAGQQVLEAANDAAATALAATLTDLIPVVIHVTTGPSGGRESRLYYGTGAADYVLMTDSIGINDQNITGNRILSNAGNNSSFTVDINDGGGIGATMVLDPVAGDVLLRQTTGVDTSELYLDANGAQLGSTTAAGTSVVATRGGDVLLAFSATGDLKLDNQPGVAGQVIQSQGPNLPPVWANAGVDTNYVTGDLVAAATRSHTWSTFGLTETFTTGTRSVTAVDGANNSQITQTAGQLTLNQVGAAGTSNLTFLPASATLQHDIGGVISAVEVQTTGVDIQIDNGKDLRINNLPGTAGQVLTSQGAGLPPIWAAGASLNYATGNLTANANRQHDWTGFEQRETWTSGQHIRVFTFGGQTFTQTENVGGVTKVQAGPASTSTHTQTNTQHRLRVEDTFGAIGEVAVSAAGINLIFATTADLSINGNPGTSGQALLSQGNNAAPVWGNVPQVPSVVAKTVAQWTGPVGGVYTLTCTAAEHLRGTNVTCQIWDMSTVPGSRSAFVPDSLTINTTTGLVTVTVQAIPDARVDLQFVVTAL